MKLKDKFKEGDKAKIVWLPPPDIFYTEYNVGDVVTIRSYERIDHDTGLNLHTCYKDYSNQLLPSRGLQKL